MAKSTSIKKRLTAKEWSQIENLYGSGEHTIQKLSTDFGVPYRTIQHHLNSRGVIKGAGASSATSERETALNYRSAAKSIVIKLTNALSEAIDEITPGPGRATQIQRLTISATKLVSLAEDCGLISEDDQMPTLVVMELTAADIQKMREKQRDEDAELGISAMYEEPRDYDAEGVVCEGEHEDEDDDGIHEEAA